MFFFFNETVGINNNFFLTGLVSTKGMTFRTGKEKHTIVSGGGISKYAIDLKPISIAAVLPERLPLLKLDIEVIYCIFLLRNEIKFFEELILQNSMFVPI